MANIRTFTALTPDNEQDNIIQKGDLPNAYIWADNNELEYIELPKDIIPRTKTDYLQWPESTVHSMGNSTQGTYLKSKETSS